MAIVPLLSKFYKVAVGTSYEVGSIASIFKLNSSIVSSSKNYVVESSSFTIN